MHADPLVVCQGLVKIYDSSTGRVQAVNGIDLEIGTGHVVAVVGPSGSGKSSLLRMIAGIDVPTAGRVTVAGVDLTVGSAGRRAARRARLVTHVHQHPGDNFVAQLTIGQQLHGRAKRSSWPRSVDDTLALLGLLARRDHLPAELSGGEQVRAAFARAIVAGHRLVIADEPTAELDTASTASVMRVIDELAASGTTVLVATHDQRVIDRVPTVMTLGNGSLTTVSSRLDEWAVIDGLGRLQLPPTVAARFPAGRARLTWDEAAQRLTVEGP